MHDSRQLGGPCGACIQMFLKAMIGIANPPWAGPVPNRSCFGRTDLDLRVRLCPSIVAYVSVVTSDIARLLQVPEVRDLFGDEVALVETPSQQNAWTQIDRLTDCAYLSQDKTASYQMHRPVGRAILIIKQML